MNERIRIDVNLNQLSPNEKLCLSNLVQRLAQRPRMDPAIKESLDDAMGSRWEPAGAKDGDDA